MAWERGWVSVWNESACAHKVSDSKEQAELGRKMREAWTTFAKDPKKGLTGLKWPRYNSSLGKFRYEGIKLILLQDQPLSRLVGKIVATSPLLVPPDTLQLVSICVCFRRRSLASLTQTE